MKNIALSIFIPILFLCSCNQDQNTPTTLPETEFVLPPAAAELYRIVGEKHDTAMLLMGNIGGMQSALRLKLGQIKEDNAQKDSVLTLLSALKKADDGMMDWMREFKNTDLNEDEYKAMSQEEIMAYLKSEETKIEQVHQDMLNSIANSKKFLFK